MVHLTCYENYWVVYVSSLLDFTGTYVISYLFHFLCFFSHVKLLVFFCFILSCYFKFSTLWMYMLKICCRLPKITPTVNSYSGFLDIALVWIDISYAWFVLTGLFITLMWKLSFTYSAGFPWCYWCSSSCEKVAQISLWGAVLIKEDNDFCYQLLMLIPLTFLLYQVREELGIGNDVKVVIFNFGGQVQQSKFFN